MSQFIPKFDQLRNLCVRTLKSFPYAGPAEFEIGDLEMLGDTESLRTTEAIAPITQVFHITVSVRSTSLKGTNLKMSFVAHWWGEWTILQHAEYTVSFNHSELKKLMRFNWHRNVSAALIPSSDNDLEEVDYFKRLIAI